MKRISKIVLVLYSLLFLATSFHIHPPSFENTHIFTEEQNESSLFHINLECSLTPFRAFVHGFYTSEFSFQPENELKAIIEEILVNSSFVETPRENSPRAPPELV